MRNILILAFAFLAMTYVTSCQKKPVIIPPKEEPGCRITYYKYSSFAITLNFAYNAAGNPVNAVTPPPPGTTGFPNVYFSYDKFNRVSEFISYYWLVLDSNSRVNLTGTSYLQYIKYAYADDNPASMPVRDTFRFGQYPGGPIMYVGVYEYDRDGRITKRTTPVNPIDNTKTYEYDANGNLILPGVTYDSGKNYRGRNKVFMLIDKNYSVNNPFIATSYNAEGYPVLLSGFNSDLFLYHTVADFEMRFDCSGTGKTN